MTRAKKTYVKNPNTKFLSALMLGMGGASFAVIFFLYFFLISKVIRLYAELNFFYNALPVYIVLGTYSLAAFIELICGGVLISKRQSSSKVRKIGIALFCALVVSFFLMVPFMIFSVILPVYSLTREVN